MLEYVIGLEMQTILDDVRKNELQSLWTLTANNQACEPQVQDTKALSRDKNQPC
jgi:hypothetical protein